MFRLKCVFVWAEKVGKVKLCNSCGVYGLDLVMCV